MHRGMGLGLEEIEGGVLRGGSFNQLCKCGYCYAIRMPCRWHSQLEN
jgi:hypothetical protein